MLAWLRAFRQQKGDGDLPVPPQAGTGVGPTDNHRRGAGFGAVLLFSPALGQPPPPPPRAAAPGLSRLPRLRCRWPSIWAASPRARTF